MINPKLEETKKQFIDRGLKDEAVIDWIPDPTERIKTLGAIFDKATGNDMDLIKFKANIVAAMIPQKGEKGLDGTQGKDGANGKDGKDGYTPIKGYDYFTAEDIKEVQKDILKQIKIPAPQVTEKTIIQKVPAEVPIDAINALIQSAFDQFDIPATEIKLKLESLKGDQRIDASAIKNLPKATAGQYIGVGGNNFNIGIGLTNANNVLTNDLLTGKAGGQTIYGGTGAGDSLTLVSTTDSSKGYVQIGAMSQLFANSRGLAGSGITQKLAQFTVRQMADFTATGTVATSAGSPIVTGTGTKFLTDLAVGDRVTVSGEGIKSIISITSDTVATTDANYVGTNSGLSMVVKKTIFSAIDNANRPRVIIDDLGTFYFLRTTDGAKIGQFSMTTGGSAIQLISQSGSGTINLGVSNNNNAIYINPRGFIGVNQTSGLPHLGITQQATFTGTGTVSTTTSSSTLTGVGTAFLSQLGVGDKVVIGGTETRYIKSVTSDTVATFLINSGATSTQSGVTFTITKASFALTDNGGNARLVSSADTPIVAYIGTVMPDYDSGSKFAGVFSDTGSNQLMIQATQGGEARLSFGNSITVGSSLTYFSSIRDNNIASGYTKFRIVASGNSVGDMLTISGYQRGIGVIATTKLATLTVQSLADVVGTGTVSNSAGGTTVTGTGTFFTLQCAVGDRVIINGETVYVTAIASNTSMTTQTITGANSGVAFTVKKAIFTGITAGGTTKFVISDSGNIGIGLEFPGAGLDLNVTTNIRDGNNISLGSTTGAKIATASTQKLAFWNATPVVQPTTSVTASTIVGGAGTTVKEDHTFDGYTIGQVVKALRTVGILA